MSRQRQRQRQETPIIVDHVSETDPSVATDDENDENRPVHDTLHVARTPLTHSRAEHDALRDITDQFFHPPSPSPVRVSKLKRAAPPTVDPPRRPKKPKSLAYPADPPNWLYSPSSSSLPPSSPFPPSIHVPSVRHPTPLRHVYRLGTPTGASDSDPFGFVAVERALKAKRPAPKPAPRISAVKSPPRSTVLAAPSHARFASFSQLDTPVATNNEDIEGLYTDGPVSGPSYAHVPVAPLLMMNSDLIVQAPRAQATFPDPLRTPRKRTRCVSPSPDQDEQGSDTLSTPSPVKLSTVYAQSTHTPVIKLTRARTRAADTGKPTTRASRTKPIKRSYQHIPTPSSTRPSASSRPSTAPPTPIPPRRSTRQAAVGARAKLKRTKSSDGENAAGSEDGEGNRMTLRSRTKANKERTTSKETGRAKHPPSRSKAPPKTRKTVTTTKSAPARGRPRGKSGKDDKGKGKARPLESVLDLSDDTRERYEKERRERLEYFKRLEGYQMQKENVYVV